MKVLFLLPLLLLAACQDFRYLASDQQAGSTEQLVEAFAGQQREIHQKVFLHFVQEEIDSWRARGFSGSEIRSRIVELVSSPAGELAGSLKKFMEAKLFAKLEMELLTDSLKKEIRAQPEDYYLTFEIYDLLVD